MEVWCLRVWDQPGTTVPASAPSLLLPISLSPLFMLFLIVYLLHLLDLWILSFTFFPRHLFSIFLSSVSFSALSHDNEPFHTVIHRALLCKCTLLSPLSLLLCFLSEKLSVTQGLDSIIAAQHCFEALRSRIEQHEAVTWNSSSTADC